MTGRPLPTDGGDSRPPDRRRRLVLALAAVVLLVAAAIAVVGLARGDGTTPAARASKSPSAGPSGTAAEPAALPRRNGITFGSALYGRTTAQVRAALDEVRRLHMGWIRIDLSWALVQPVSATTADWTPIDTVVREARTRKLAVLGLVTYTPAWARSPGCRSFVCPPRSATEFADFAASAVERYAPRGVTTYQLWNEPNLDQFWTDPDPAAYGGLVAAAVPAMRAATTSTITVVSGGLGYAGTDPAATARGDVDAGRFLALACTRSRCPVDAVGYDPATYPNLPSATGSPLNAWQLLSRSAPKRTSMRAAMAASGLGDKQVWITGFGAPTTFRGATTSRVVSDRVQGEILLDGLRLAGRARASVGAFFVDTLRDTATRGTFRDHFGLLRADGSRKPAFTVLQTELGR